MPLAIHSVVVADQGRVLKAQSNDGRVFEPNPEPIESSMSPLPPAPKCLEGDEEYSLAPIESQQQPMAFAADLTSHYGVVYTKQTHKPNWTPLEARDFRMELALRRLFVREKAHVSRENAEVLAGIITSSTEKVTTSATVLTDTCKRLVLMAGGNSRAHVVSGLCRKWLEDHHNRSLWKELVWRDYYQDLTIIAPLLCGIESDLNRAEVSAYDAKLAERRKR